jgi:hypothetical protein
MDVHGAQTAGCGALGRRPHFSSAAIDSTKMAPTDPGIDVDRSIDPHLDSLQGPPARPHHGGTERGAGSRKWSRSIGCSIPQSVGG